MLSFCIKRNVKIKMSYKAYQFDIFFNYLVSKLPNYLLHVIFLQRTHLDQKQIVLQEKSQNLTKHLLLMHRNMIHNNEWVITMHDGMGDIC